jgi:ABC-type transport system involved in multi-copper enzyme maturation permease subunit
MKTRQLAAIYMLALRRLIRSNYVWGVLVLCALPVGIAILIAVTATAHKNAGEAANAYQMMLRTLFIHFIVFFVGNLSGYAVIRQDVDERTLHYLFLQPVKRWTLVLAKFLAFITLSGALCVASIWITYFILVLPQAGGGGLVADLFAKGRFIGLVEESVVVVLGLMAFGSLAMLMASFFKSQAYALFWLLWECGLPYLPSIMKKFTVMHYLQSLLPEPATGMKKMFEMLGEPASTLQSVTVLVGFAVIVTAVAVAFFHLKECIYADAA